MKMCNQLDELKDKFKVLSSLFDRLVYEFEEDSKGATSASQSLSRLLYMSKADRVYAEDAEKIEKFLRGIGGEWTEREGKRERREEIVVFMNFCIKYIRSIEVKILRKGGFSIECVYVKVEFYW